MASDKCIYATDYSKAHLGLCCLTCERRRRFVRLALGLLPHDLAIATGGVEVGKAGLRRLLEYTGAAHINVYACSKAVPECN